MLTRREYYVRLCVGAVVGVAWCLGGGWYLHGLGWSFGLILLLDVAVTGALVHLLGVYPAPYYDRYTAHFLTQSQDARADSRVQLPPPAP